MNSIVKETLDKLRQCDDFHNRCDYLLEHSEITYLLEYIELNENIIKEVREILNNKRSILTIQLLSGGYCDYEELLYQVDEEIGRTLDKVGETDDSKRNV